jgi:queuine tRNA-ribosyltransferase
VNTSSRLDFRLEAEATGSQARAARFRTLHNEVLTPLFMPVGTQATVKAQLPKSLEDSGSQILLANTYHLLLRPGPRVFERMGGIHPFMNWKRSVLTDSGGYQIFSLPHSRSMSEAGAIFQSYVDGEKILLSPEKSIETQKSIGSDIMMVLDQCIPSTAPKEAAIQALQLTHRWAARSLAARGDSPQSMFGIVQGALFQDLRRESVERLAEMPFDGLAIGGLAVGEGKSEREDFCEFTASLMPKDKPRYLMGVGTPLDILEAVHRGMDMFDCIIPTQLAQRGGVFTSRGFLQLRRSVYKYSEDRLDPLCDCLTCTHFSRAYLHHLTKTQEPLGWQLFGQHNIHFYHRMMSEIRESILKDRFVEYYREKRVILELEDIDNPVEVKNSKVRKQTPLVRGAYAVHSAVEGFSSIRHVSSGEIMHSRTPPLEEAKSLYIDQSQLAQRIQAQPLVIWDVGLGAAANAMAAVRAYEELGPTPSLQLISFENDLDSLRLALDHREKFPYLRHGGPDAILKKGEWHSKTHPGLSWVLMSGDFLETMKAAPHPPDLIFYDMFSKNTFEEQWGFEIFSRLFEICRGHPTELFTYTASTAARVALLASGFLVARGRSAGEKQETTIALTPEARAEGGARHELLGPEWLLRWSRSAAKFPADLASERHPWFEKLILGHEQFREKA